jgi:FKBP-type peptidyl-prolyl cis-trans isomerase
MIQKSDLKTSTPQRIVIIFIAILMVGSTIALYMGIVLSSRQTPTEADDEAAQIAEIQARMVELDAQLSAHFGPLSDQYFDQLMAFRPRITSFNAAAATFNTIDLRVGDGALVTEDFHDYAAYYIGWIADGTIFDTSFDTPTCVDTLGSPTRLNFPLPGGQMIEGWNLGIEGMRIGGIREITMQSDLAYKDQERGCIPANSPLRFIVLLIPPHSEEIAEMLDEYNFYRMYGF